MLYRYLVNKKALGIVAAAHPLPLGNGAIAEPRIARPSATADGNAHGISLTCIRLLTARGFQFKKTDWKSV